MGNAMAIRAFRELAHDSCGMRNTVAVLTFRHHFVFFLVTGYAKKCLMLGFAGCEQAVCLCVTGCALLGRCVSCIGDHFRHVSLMALLAVASILLSRVRLMALGTLRNLAVYIVAE